MNAVANCQLLRLLLYLVFAAENDGNAILDLQIIEIFLGEHNMGINIKYIYIQ